MKVNIGVLKNQLSKYLHKVRKGEEITVTDRNEPIAKLIPLERSFVNHSDIATWLKKHPPIKTKTPQPPSAEMLRQIRDEE